jgi:hypothetical protein
VNLALLARLHAKSARELFSDLVAAVDSLPGAMHEIGNLIADEDSLATERLERLSERFTGLHRLALQTRAAFINEFHGDGPEAA